MRINKSIKKILLEQSEWEKLSAAEQIEANTRFSVIELRYSRIGCELKKFGSKWFKKCSSPPTPPTGLEKYVGQYQGSGMLPDFEVKEKDGKLVVSSGFINIELTNVSGDKFKGSYLRQDAEIEFTISNNVANGGKITYAGQTINFTKKSSSPTPSPTSTPNTPASPWDCIVNFNKEYNQFDLIDEGDYRYEQVEGQENGQETIFMYYKNYDAVWAYMKNKKPILKGRWECKGDKGYLIKWSDGQVSRYGTKDSGLSGQTNNNTTTDTLENPCPNGYKDGCVSEEDILNKKKALKVCRKCDLVKKIQENPEIKARIFRIQKELGKEQKTDNVFGPIMLAAVKEFQSSHGINPTGNVGEKTLTQINSYSAPKVEEPKVNVEPKIKEPEVKVTNKAEVKPIYRRSSRQVLSPDDEL